MMPPEEPLPVSLGQVVDGKYRIERLLGRGGMGVIFAATHLHLEQLVALKFMKPQATANPTLVQRFMREARAACRLKGEHVARVTDVSALPSGEPFMVIEHLEGQDLGTLTKGHLRLSVLEAVDYLLQVADAIGEAHALGIVHRDLKPSNLFLTRRANGRACVKVLDFGISKLAEGAGSDDGMTRTGAVLGSPHYMPPEQMRSSKTADPRSDIWSLGVVLYRLLIGRAPFEAETMPELCAMIIQDPVPSLCGARPEIPQGLEAVIFRCLEKDPARRFQSVADLVTALEPFAAAGPDSSQRLIAVPEMRAIRPSLTSFGVPASESPTRTSNPGAPVAPISSPGFALAPGAAAMTASAPPVVAGSTGPSLGSWPGTGASWSGTQPGTVGSRARSGLIGLGVATGVAAILIAGFVLLRRPSSEAAAAAPALDSAATLAIERGSLETAEPTSAPPPASSASAVPSAPAITASARAPVASISPFAAAPPQTSAKPAQTSAKPPRNDRPAPPAAPPPAPKPRDFGGRK